MPPTSCSPRSTRPCAGWTAGRADRAVRYRRLRPRPAARTGRRFPLDPLGSARRRPAAARHRRGRSAVARRTHRPGGRRPHRDRRRRDSADDWCSTRSTGSKAPCRAATFHQAGQPDPGATARRIWLSAISGAGLDAAARGAGERFRDRQVSGELILAPDQGRLRARLHAVGAVRSESADEAGWRLQLEMPVATAERLATEPGGHLLHGLLLVAPSAPTYNPDIQ